MICESLKILIGSGIFKYDELDSFLRSVENIYNKMRKISFQPIKEIKQKLSLPNFKRVNLFLSEKFPSDFDRFKNHFPNFVKEYTNSFKKENNIFFDEDDNYTKYIIHGDYIYKNENVEIFLHQRTMKKIKYKKRDYNNLHPVDAEMIKQIMENKDSLIN